jgi:hypothetical protein
VEADPRAAGYHTNLGHVLQAQGAAVAGDGAPWRSPRRSPWATTTSGTPCGSRGTFAAPPTATGAPSGSSRTTPRRSVTWGTSCSARGTSTGPGRPSRGAMTWGPGGRAGASPRRGGSSGATTS